PRGSRGEGRSGSRSDHPPRRFRHRDASVGHAGCPGRTDRQVSAIGGGDETKCIRSGRPRSRQSAFRRQGRVRNVPPCQRDRIAARTRPEQHRPTAAGRGARDVGCRSRQGDPLQQPDVPRRAEGRHSSNGPLAQSRQLHCPDARQQGNAAVVRQSQSPRLRLRRRVADAIVQRQAHRPGTGRRRELPRVAEGQGQLIMRRTLIAVVALAASIAVVHAQNVTFERISHPEREPQNWLSYSQNLFNQRFSPLTQITPANAKNLELQWVWQSKSLEKFEATALVVDGVLYTLQGPPQQGVYEIVALDATTGRPFWTLDYRPALEARPCCGRVSRGLAILGDTLYMGTIDAHLVAIDAKTGK